MKTGDKNEKTGVGLLHMFNHFYTSPKTYFEDMELP